MIAHEYGRVNKRSAVKFTYGGNGRGPGEFDGPKGVAAVTYERSNGKEETLIAVSEAGNSRVQIMRPDGSAARFVSNGTGGSAPGQLENPSGVDFGGSEPSDPSLAVADRGNHRIQVWTSLGEAHAGEDGCFGTFGECSTKKGGSAAGGKRKGGLGGGGGAGDYRGLLCSELSELRLNKPGGVCWVESEEKRNWLVVADTGNHRLQLLDLDLGTVRVLCGKEKVTAPVAVSYHNGWRWCSGVQATKPHQGSALWELPAWFLAHGSSSKGGGGQEEGAGGQHHRPSSPPPQSFQNKKPTTAAQAEKDAIAVAEELFQVLEVEKVSAVAEFEERQKLAGGRLGESELEEAMEQLYGNFRVWRKLGKTHGPGVRDELVVGVLTEEAFKTGEAAALRRQPRKLAEYAIAVQRSVLQGRFSQYLFRGKAYSDLYLLLDRFALVPKARWQLPPHPSLLAVAEPSISRVGVLGFWPPQHDCEYFPAFVRPRAPAGGADLPGRLTNPQNQFERPSVLSMSPYGDLAIGDYRAANGGPQEEGEGGKRVRPLEPRVVVYNVLSGAVGAVVNRPWRKLKKQASKGGGGGGGGGSDGEDDADDEDTVSEDEDEVLEAKAKAAKAAAVAKAKADADVAEKVAEAALVASNASHGGGGGGGGDNEETTRRPGEEGEGEDEEDAEVFPSVPSLLLPCLLPGGGFWCVSNDGRVVVLQAPSSRREGRARSTGSEGNCGSFLSRLPPKLVNGLILPHLTYRNAEQARLACRYLHDWTRQRRNKWKLWPLQPVGLKRIKKSFVDWARLGDGRSLHTQHPPFLDFAGGDGGGGGSGAGRPLCERFLRGRCEAGSLCNKSHAPPEVDESVPDREFEEVCFAADVRYPLGVTLSETRLEASFVDPHSDAFKAGVRCSWRLLKVGSQRVVNGRDLELATEHYRSNPSECDGWGRGNEGQATWSSRRPVMLVFQDWKPSRPYFAVMEWSGVGGFYCACTEYFGLKWWWAHEDEIRELFLAKAGLFALDERRDLALKGLETQCLRLGQAKPFPTPALAFAPFVELMTLLTEIRFELASFRLIFASLFPPPQTHRQRMKTTAPRPPSSPSNATSLPLVTGASSSPSATSPSSRAGSGGGGSRGSSRGGGSRSREAPAYARVLSGQSVSKPLSWKDGTPLLQKILQGGGGSGGGGVGEDNDDDGDEWAGVDEKGGGGSGGGKPGRGGAGGTGHVFVHGNFVKGGLMMPATSNPPQARGLGLDPLKTHVITFDYQTRRLDAALSALF